MVDRMQRHLRTTLIEEVQKYEILYNTQHEHHRDNDARDRAWIDISKRMNVNCEILKREWKILRDSLRQAIRKNKFMKNKKTPTKKWFFESKMTFLVPHMTKRPPYTYPDNTGIQDIKMDGSDMPFESEPAHAAPAAAQPGWKASDDGDGLDLFFASVCMSCKRLPKKLQSQVKRQVLDALVQAEEMEREVDNTTDAF